MDSTELLATFRSEVFDQVEPYLWSDLDALGYMDDAQKMFCRLTGGLGDATTVALTTLSYTTTTDVVTLSPLILKIRNAYNTADGKPIEVINYEDMTRMSLRFDGVVNPPKYLVTGLGAHTARLYPFPSAAGSMQLMIDRLPLVAITDTDQTLEVDDQHKQGLNLWMKARAYGKQDAETMNRTKAAEFEASFRAYCAFAKGEKERAMHKTRVVAYGGI